MTFRPPRFRLLPDTLVGRTVLVLLGGLLLSQMAALALYSINRSNLALRMGGRQTGEQAAAAVQLVESNPAADRGRLVHAIDMPGLRVGWGTAPIARGEQVVPEFAENIRTEVARRLHGHDVRVAVVLPGSRPPESLPAKGSGLLRGLFDHALHPLVLLSVHLDDNSWLNFVAPQRPHETLWHLHFFLPLGIGLAAVIFASLLAVSWATRPLAVLAAAAQRLGRDVTAPPVAEKGTREVRAAAHAFNEMQASLRRFVEDRTQMIAAISHDLRTPITRLKLRAEFVEDEDQRCRMLADLDEMEVMISSTLAFARDDAETEARGPVDLAAMLAELSGDMGMVYRGPSSLVVQGGAVSLKRAFANLVGNALKYGGGGTVTLRRGGDGVIATIEDGGPGIPAPEMERVFAPFYRVERSRNRDFGGTGLGLAVARTAVRAHGGDIALANRPEGGLRVTVTLPL